MMLSHTQHIEIARRHAEAEGAGDLDATLATMDPDPVYYFHPLDRKFTGMAATRRYYEHFLSDFKPRIRGIEFHSEMIGSEGLAQEYTLQLAHDDGTVHPHRILGVLLFGVRGLAGERLYSDDTLFRFLTGPLWDQLETL
ncbi:MAG: nuclear transport factor 2 family protein [Proteobacteria bacterium]|nr:nuclear transport factor 2 family protein [Pseudomonadota bacterium]HQR03613.1 nuclear transport factor 2 family protein [Rhodocyclaceae bacterium]